jgi:hypothetical protein
MADLPDTPATPNELFEKSTATLEKLEESYEDLTIQPSVQLKTWIKKKRYGAKVAIAWMAPEIEFCSCKNENSCSERVHGPFAVKNCEFVINSDYTLLAFEHALEAEFKFCLNFTPSQRKDLE